MVHFTMAESQRVLTMAGQVDEIRVEAKPGVSQTQVVANIRAAHLPNTEALTGTKAAADAKNAGDRFLSFFTVFLLVFALIALLVGAFIIANTFSILVAQRTRELALMRAIGASRGQVLVSVVIEAAVVGIIASAVGLGLGYLVATGLQNLLMGNSGLAAGTTLSPRTVIASFVIGIGVTVLSALLPARKAAKVAPVTAMRDAAIEDTSRGLGRAIVGAIFLVIAALALVGGRDLQHRTARGSRSAGRTGGRGGVRADAGRCDGQDRRPAPPRVGHGRSPRPGERAPEPPAHRLHCVGADDRRHPRLRDLGVRGLGGGLDQQARRHRVPR